MEKDFEGWFKKKKEIEKYQSRKKYHTGDVWWFYTGLNIGFEQDGKGDVYSRPCLIIKGFNKEVCLIVPLTTKYKDSKFYVSVGLIENKSACAIISQIKLIDTKRLVNQIGFIKTSKLNEIKKAIWNLIR